MKIGYKVVILFLLIIAALSAYSYGVATGIFLFIIAGFLLEGTFWLTLFAKKSKLTSRFNHRQ